LDFSYPKHKLLHYILIQGHTFLIAGEVRLAGEIMSASLSWIALFVAGLFEVGWAIGLKYTEGFSRFWPSAGTALSMVISVGLLGVALKALPVGTAYAVWVGIGAVGTVVLGMFLLGEVATPARLGSIALIVLGIIGLKLSS
jgi:quaternary ammonium compound-resistance protein SugE